MPRFNEGSALLFKAAVDSGITSPRELANLMGNASVETGHFRRMHESFAYSSADNVIAAVASADDRFTRHEVEAAVASRDPEQVAKVMYENRSDLRNNEPGDGWRFHGRGYLQYTGRDNYERYGGRFGVDLVNSPDLAADPRTAARLAVAYWLDRVPEASRTDPVGAGRVINGGDNGKDARVAASRDWTGTITPELVEDVRTGKVSLEQLTTIGGSARDPIADGVLKQKEHGEAVKAMQEKLAGLGYAGTGGKPLTSDGDFGPNTRHAVEQFQRDHGLTVDGKAGPKTLEGLETAVQAKGQAGPATTADKPAAPSPVASSMADEGHPDHGRYRDAVEKLQALDQQRARGGLSALFADRRQLENAAGQVVFESKVSGLKQVDAVVARPDGQGVFAVQGQLGDPASQRVYVDRAQAPGQDVQAITRQVEALAQMQEQARTQSQNQVMR
jgi:putative chitinase